LSQGRGARPERELTNLEYVVLGLISIEPQSGYSIISVFDSRMYNWSASPGSIYPMLKRLEKQGLLKSELEKVHELRPRKLYQLTRLGETFLDKWLTQPLSKNEVSRERDIVLLKFLFAEKRLSRPAVLAWLDHYEQETVHYETLLRLNREQLLEEWTPHARLLVEADFMSLKMQRAWIALARARLSKQD